MKMIIQKVLSAKVIFEDNSFNSIDDGLLVYLGVHKDDTEKDIDLCVKKLLGLRIFEYSDFFYNSKLISVLPLDFYYPGKGKSGDLPPRLECADKWHKLLISNMPNIELIILIGFYAQKYYLGNKVKKNLTETVKNYKIYLPKYIPLVHPSPLNFRWFNRNPWFEENISFLKQKVKEIIGGNK